MSQPFAAKLRNLVLASSTLLSASLVTGCLQAEVDDPVAASTDKSGFEIIRATFRSQAASDYSLGIKASQEYEKLEILGPDGEILRTRENVSNVYQAVGLSNEQILSMLGTPGFQARFTSGTDTYVKNLTIAA